MTPQPPRPSDSRSGVPVRFGADGPVVGWAEVTEDETGLKAEMYVDARFAVTDDGSLSIRTPEKPDWLHETVDELFPVRWAPGTRPEDADR